MHGQVRVASCAASRFRADNRPSSESLAMFGGWQPSGGSKSAEACAALRARHERRRPLCLAAGRFADSRPSRVLQHR